MESFKRDDSILDPHSAEFFKNLRCRSYVQAKAATAAERGLSGQPLKDFVKQRLDEAFDESGLALELNVMPAILAWLLLLLVFMIKTNTCQKSAGHWMHGL